MKKTKKIISSLMAALIIVTAMVVGGVTASAASLKKPTGLTLKNTIAAVQISWNKVSGAKKYQVYCDGKLFKTTTVTSIKNFSVHGGNVYSFKVRAINGKKTSPFTATKKIMRMNTTFIYTVTNVDSGLKLTWGSREGADKYILERRASGKYSKVATTTKTYYTDKDTVSGTKYRYRITCYNNATKAYSNVGVTAAAYRLATVTGVKAVKATDSRSIDLSWLESSGAGSYNVYRQKITDKYFTKVAATTSTQYTDTDILENPSAYRYYITAAKGSTESAVSVERFVHTFGTDPAYFDVEHEGVRNYHVPLKFKVGDVYEEGKYLTDYFSYNGTFDVTILEGEDVVSIEDNVITATKAGTAKVKLHVTDSVKQILDDVVQDDLVSLLTKNDVILEITVE